MDLASLLILARLLLPSDFGLASIALTIISIVDVIFDLPVSQILIRAPAPSRAMFDTAFTLALLRGALLAGVMTALAWPLATYYGQERLPGLIIVLALAPVCKSLASPKMTAYVRRLEFRPSMIIDLSGKLTSLIVAATIAGLTGSYWAIVIGPVANQVVSLALSYRFAPHLPRLTLKDWRLFRDMIGWNSLSQVLSAINWQVDRIILPFFIASDALGRYTIAQTVTALPMQTFVQPLAQPLLAALSVNQELGALRSAYCKASHAIFALTAPAWVGLIVLADPIVRVALGEQWGDTAPMLRWISLAALIALPTAAFGSLAFSMNRTRFIAARSIYEILFRVPLTAGAIAIADVNGALFAAVAGAVLILVGTMVLIRRLVELSFLSQLIAVSRPAAAAAIACAAGVLLQAILGPGGGLGTTCIVAVVTGILILTAYSVALLLLWRAAGSPAGFERILLDRVAGVRVGLSRAFNPN